VIWPFSWITVSKINRLEVYVQEDACLHYSCLRWNNAGLLAYVKETSGWNPEGPYKGPGFTCNGSLRAVSNQQK
jgi:hypothetical protein